jgi:hypothetical protein
LLQPSRAARRPTWSLRYRAEGRHEAANGQTPTIVTSPTSDWASSTRETRRSDRGQEQELGVLLQEEGRCHALRLRITLVGARRKYCSEGVCALVATLVKKEPKVKPSPVFQRRSKWELEQTFTGQAGKKKARPNGQALLYIATFDFGLFPTLVESRCAPLWRAFPPLTWPCFGRAFFLYPHLFPVQVVKHTFGRFRDGR